jgi:hypothetical protein
MSRRIAIVWVRKTRLLSLVLLCSFILPASAQTAREKQQALDEVLHVWKWKAYWQGSSPLIRNTGKVVVGTLLMNRGGAGMCSANLELCCYYYRVWPSGPLNPDGDERSVGHKPNDALATEYMRARTQRENSAGISQVVEGPSRSSGNEIDPLHPLDPRLLDGDPTIVAHVHFNMPESEVPKRNTLPADEGAAASLLASIVSGVRSSRSRCKFQDVDIPFVSERDGEAVVLGHGTGCDEVIRLMRWDLREWRFIDSRPADARYEQLIRAALWRTISVN